MGTRSSDQLLLLRTLRQYYTQYTTKIPGPCCNEKCVCAEGGCKKGCVCPSCRCEPCTQCASGCPCSSKEECAKKCTKPCKCCPKMPGPCCNEKCVCADGGCKKGCVCTSCRCELCAKCTSGCSCLSKEECAKKCTKACKCCP